MIPGVPDGLFYNFVVLGMAGMFASIVRAPITGIILLTEMTGTLTHLLSLTVISLIAYFVADRLHVKPIYDSLLENMTQDKDGTSPVAHPRARITTAMVVHHGAKAAGARIQDIDMPAGTLLISVRRNQEEILPHKDMVIQAGDYLVFLMERANETDEREKLKGLFVLN
jgi:NhaP-type Na+/H+ and K+/H+ antiporter